MIISNILIFVFLNGEFPISTATERQWHPTVASDGEKYLVIWEDTRKTGDIFNNDIWGQFVSKEGTLIDTNFPICTADSGQWEIDIAFGDSNYLIVWSDHRDKFSNDIYGQLILPDGALIDTLFSICITNYGKSYVSVIWGKNKYLVVWHENYSDSCKIWGQFVLSDGSLENSPFPVASTEWNQYPKVAFDGTNYLVIWNKYWGKSFFDIYGRFVDSAGTTIDSAFLVIQGANGAIHPDIAFDGTNYLIVSDNCGSNDTILGQLVAPDGLFIGSPVLVAVEPESGKVIPMVAWNGTNYLVVWEDFRNGNRDVYGQRISSEGSFVNTNFAVIEHLAPQDPPVIASDGTDFLVVWCDGRGADAFDIYGRIVSGTGVEESEKCKVKSTKLQVCPNPFTSHTAIKLSSHQAIQKKIRVYDLMGRLVEETKEDIIGENLRAGIYFVKIRSYKPLKIIKLR